MNRLAIAFALFFALCFVGFTPVQSSEDSDSYSNTHLAHHGESSQIINLLETLEDRLRSSIRKEQREINETTADFNEQIASKEDQIEDLKIERSAAQSTLDTLKSDKSDHVENAEQRNEFINSHEDQVELINNIRHLLLGGRDTCRENSECAADEYCVDRVCHPKINSETISHGVTETPFNDEPKVLSASDCQHPAACFQLPNISFENEFLYILNQEVPNTGYSISVDHIIEMNDYRIDIYARLESTDSSSAAGSDSSSHYAYRMIGMPKIKDSMAAAEVKVFWQ
eukprot:gb/GECH01011129.1/.p1 GENE.gb/GECH01011129.1/~~gb/GECH01011129.1/.p1  ORF type:complete len:285 (+),score=37.70 gb/GECH01011129.1/:1-855(+)